MRLLPPYCDGSLEAAKIDTYRKRNRARLSPWYQQANVKPGEIITMDGLVFKQRGKITGVTASNQATCIVSGLNIPFFPLNSTGRACVTNLVFVTRKFYELSGNTVKVLLVDLQPAYVDAPNVARFR